MISLSATRSSLKLPSHDHERKDLLHGGGKSEQETSKHESAAAKAKMEGRIIQRRPDPAESSSTTPPPALTSYFQLLFQGQNFKDCGDLKILCDNAKARPDPWRKKKKNKRLERSLSLSSDEDRCPPTTPLVRKQISRWETGSPPASTSGMKKMPSGYSAECAVRNANMTTKSRKPIQSNVHRLPLDLIVGDLTTTPRIMSASNEKKGELRIRRKEKMLAATFVQQASNIAFEQPPKPPLEQPPHNAAA